MEINEIKKIIIDDNKRKYDIYDKYEIDNNFHIYITFKRIFFNLIKRDVSPTWPLYLSIEKFYLDSYLLKKQIINIDTLFDNNYTEYVSFIIYNGEILNHERFLQKLEDYRIINLLTNI